MQGKNIKAQIIKHYQHLADREAFVTAEIVRNFYQGFGSEYEPRSRTEGNPLPMVVNF